MSRYTCLLLLAALALPLTACKDDVPTGGSDSGPAGADAGDDDVLDNSDAGDAALSDATPDVAPDLRPDADGDVAEDAPDADPDLPSECEPDHLRCISERILESCMDGELTTEECAVGQICVEDACRDIVCRPGDPLSCASNVALLVCDDTGTGQVEQPCQADFFCSFADGVYLCTNQICAPGQTRCAGLAGTETCADDGTSWLPAAECLSGTQCDNGECRSLCEINSKVSSFLGCEYWSADLDNITGGLHASHAVIVSNPHPDLAAEITVTNGAGDRVYVTGWPEAVMPGQLAIWPFDTNAVNSLDNTDLLDTAYVDGTMLGNQAFKFESSIPVTAHQFNPLIDRNVFTNDASLLLPTNAIGTEYLAMSWKHRQAGFQLRGYVTIIAVGVEPTEVQVTPTAAVVAGLDKLTNNAIPRIAPGETRTFTLQPGNILNLETEGPAEADLTGTEIIANQPITVFGGHECANIPLGFDACDHIEQQLYPVDSWGSNYAGAYFHRRGPAQVEVWRILSGADGVVLTTVPAIPNVNGITLDRGEFVEFESSEDFELSATGPILPAQYVVGTSYRNLGDGDPAFTLLVPIQQWRRSYIVLTPPAYHADYLNIVAPVNTTVTLDGVALEPNVFETFGGGDYAVARVEVGDGPHTLEGEDEFGVIAYGYDSAVSYAYPGGLNLESLE